MDKSDLPALYVGEGEFAGNQHISQRPEDFVVNIEDGLQKLNDHLKKADLPFSVALAAIGAIYGFSG